MRYTRSPSTVREREDNIRLIFSRIIVLFGIIACAVFLYISGKNAKLETRKPENIAKPQLEYEQTVMRSLRTIEYEGHEYLIRTMGGICHKVNCKYCQ